MDSPCNLNKGNLEWYTNNHLHSRDSRQCNLVNLNNLNMHSHHNRHNLKWFMPNSNSHSICSSNRRHRFRNKRVRHLLPMEHSNKMWRKKRQFTKWPMRRPIIRLRMMEQDHGLSHFPMPRELVQWHQIGMTRPQWK